MFRSITVYQVTQSYSAVLERLLEALGKKANHFRPCKDTEASSHGFVKPLGEDTKVMSYETNGATLFCLRTDEKVVPAAAVKMEVQKLVKAKEAKGEEVSKTDARLLKEEVIERLLPGAIPAPSWTYAIFDNTLGMLFVGGGDDDADAFIAALKGALGGVPFKLLALNDVDPCAVFTKMLKDPKQHLPEVFELGDACSLKHPKEGGTEVHNISHGDLEAEDLAALLKAGKECCRIGLKHEHVGFAITAKLGLRRLSLSDASKAAVAEHEDDSPGTNRSVEFAQWVLSIREVMRELETLFGGWPTQETLDYDEKDAA